MDGDAQSCMVVARVGGVVAVVLSICKRISASPSPPQRRFCPCRPVVACAINIHSPIGGLPTGRELRGTVERCDSHAVHVSALPGAQMSDVKCQMPTHQNAPSRRLVFLLCSQTQLPVLASAIWPLTDTRPMKRNLWRWLDRP
jgi:hypothetical protein